MLPYVTVIFHRGNGKTEIFMFLKNDDFGRIMIFKGKQQMMKRYDAELDTLLDSASWTHRPLTQNQILAQYVRVTVGESERLRKQMPNFSVMHYGATQAEMLDVYGLDWLSSESPVVAFVHGGGWRVNLIND